MSSGGWPCIAFGVWAAWGGYAPYQATGTDTIAGDPYLWYIIYDSPTCKKIEPVGQYCIPLKGKSVQF